MLFTLFTKDFKKMKRSPHTVVLLTRNTELKPSANFVPILPSMNDSKIELDMGCSHMLEISQLNNDESMLSTIHLM